MRRFLTIMAIVGAFFQIGGISNQVSANSKPQLLTGILNKMEKAHQEMKSLKAEFIQQKTNSQIGVTDSDYGALLYKPAVGKTKGKVRIDYTKPSNSVVSIIGDTLVYYQPRLNQALKSTVAKASKGKTGYSQLIGLDGSIKSLANNYNFDYVGDSSLNGQMTTLLRLTPKAGGQYSSIELWVSQENWLPVQQKLFERNGDFTLMTLKNLQLNPVIPDAAFNVAIPSGTKIVDKI
ncbi:MAG TPA: outer membrane lipoprotein carrier protein LolA [Blastocatellia bacterium]|nr:outer membrane lipoprotein carrier protein LolA [Blastocatellia bacterium]